MVNHTKISFSIFFFCFLGAMLCANLSISLELSDIHYLKDKSGKIIPTIFTGDSFELKVIVSGTKQAPNDINIKGLENFKTRGKHHYSNISINNSSVLAEKTTSYTILPKQEGTFTLGPATVKYDGKIHQSNSITIHVSSQANRQASQIVAKPTENKSSTQFPSDEYELFCKMHANKNVAITEEPILVTLSIFRRGNIAQIRGIFPLKFPDCTIKEIKQVKNGNQTIQGKEFAIIQKQYLVFPQKSGSLTIPPAQVVYAIREKTKHRGGFSFFDDDFFSNFFSSGLKQKTASSNHIILTIKAPPVTTEKVDGIGDFNSFEAKIDKTDVNANEPMKFTLVLHGHANFDLIEPPVLSLPSIFKTYDSKTEFFQDLETKYSPGIKSFEFILQIPKAGIWTIPAQSFHYFDTQVKQYKTMQTEPITITVTMPAGSQIEPPPSIAQKTIHSQPAQFTTDIHFIEEDVSATQEKSRRLPMIIIILLILFIPIVFYFRKIFLFLAQFYTRISFFGSKKNIFFIYQKKLIELIEYNEIEKLYSLFSTIFSYALELPAATINEDIIVKELEKRWLEKEKIDSFLTFLNECAQYSFASKQVTTINLQELFKRANYWLLLIHQTFKI